MVRDRGHSRRTGSQHLKISLAEPDRSNRTLSNCPYDQGNHLGRIEAIRTVAAVDALRAGTAGALAAGAAKGQRGIGFALDLYQRVKNHRSALAEVERETSIRKLPPSSGFPR